ncbi:T9SS type A sorting domain-containing protein [Chryseobacterium sp. POL2]|uniref:T9SS type A sorting domain-containing protein n=1 Tax=Chryseobacterium sp. POL2 TaxID=2713414 RepID=UPI0013E1F653|nr:T9SS type A sorting domain-containing protein [Chryseobacterium sp. POL2]QIG89023.1 T9SS type A sorting domain-containing protein [Chryseobacterium sp. POL2]
MKKVLCSLAVGFAALSFGQINKSQGFEVDNGDFANASFFRSKTTPVCEGSYGLIRNFWSGGKTGSTTFSSFSSNGQSIDVSFKYRTYNFPAQSNNVVDGTMFVEYSIDGGTTYTNIGTIALNQIITCANFSYTIPAGEVPQNAAFKLRVSGQQLNSGDFYLILDDFKFSQGTLATSDIKKSDVTIYPNPVKDILYVNNADAKTLVKITDLSGRQIKETQLLDNRVNLTELKSGTYIITIIDKNGKSTNQKFVKK